uniref:Glutaredoxin domain-containing protein n=1 Tax=Eutreptiella gymnastica TaxID=73025 RepID=A0A7S4CDU3_9EUGL
MEQPSNSSPTATLATHTSTEYRTTYLQSTLSTDGRSEIDKRFKDIITRVKRGHSDEVIEPRKEGTSLNTSSSSAIPPHSTAYDETKAMMEKLRASISNLSEQIDESLSPHTNNSLDYRTLPTSLGRKSPVPQTSPNRRPGTIPGGPEELARRPSAGPMASEDFRHAAFTGLRPRHPEYGPIPAYNATTSTPRQLVDPMPETGGGLSSLLNKQKLSWAHRSMSTPTTTATTDRISHSPTKEPEHTYPPTSGQRHSTIVVSSILQELEEDRARLSSDLAAQERENAHLKDAHLKTQSVVEQLEQAYRSSEAKNRGLEQELVDTRYELSCLKREHEQLKKRNEILGAELQFTQIEKKDEVERDRNMLVFLQHEKDRMQRQIELLKHNINALLEISKLSIEDLEKLGAKMNAEAVVQGDQSDSLIEPMEAVALPTSASSKSALVVQSSPPRSPVPILAITPIGDSKVPKADQSIELVAHTSTPPQQDLTYDSMPSGTSALKTSPAGSQSPGTYVNTVAAAVHTSTVSEATATTSAYNTMAPTATHDHRSYVTSATAATHSPPSAASETTTMPPAVHDALSAAIQPYLCTTASPATHDAISAPSQPTIQPYLSTTVPPATHDAISAASQPSVAAPSQPTEAEASHPAVAEERMPGLHRGLTAYTTSLGIVDPMQRTNSRRLVQLLTTLGFQLTEVDLAQPGSPAPALINQASGTSTLPQLFMGPNFVGTFQEIEQLNELGGLTQRLMECGYGGEVSRAHLSQSHGPSAAASHGHSPSFSAVSPAFNAYSTSPQSSKIPTITTRAPTETTSPQNKYNLSPVRRLQDDDENVYTQHSDDNAYMTDDAMDESDVEITIDPSLDNIHAPPSSAPQIDPSPPQPPARNQRSQKTKGFCCSCGQTKLSSFTHCPSNRIAHPLPEGSEGPPLLCTTCTVPAFEKAAVQSNASSQSCVEAFKKGYPLMKYNLSNAKSTRKWIKLTPDCARLQWASKPNSPSLSVVYLNTVTEITYNFLPHKDKAVQPANTTSPKMHLRFSLVTEGRTVDFEAQTREVFIIIFIALYSLVYPEAPPMTVGRLLWWIAGRMLATKGCAFGCKPKGRRTPTRNVSS